MKPAASGSSSNANAKQALVPTNTVTTKDGVSVRARIDPSLVRNHNGLSCCSLAKYHHGFVCCKAVVDVVRQLCTNLKVPDHPALYALRDEQDVLVTDENLLKKIREKAHLKYVPTSHYLRPLPERFARQVGQFACVRGSGDCGEAHCTRRQVHENGAVLAAEVHTGAASTAFFIAVS